MREVLRLRRSQGRSIRESAGSVGVSTGVVSLHLEYLERYPEGLKYTAFADRYRRWKRQRRVSMRQEQTLPIGYKPTFTPLSSSVVLRP